jgi:hypothetical protein
LTLHPAQHHAQLLQHAASSDGTLQQLHLQVSQQQGGRTTGVPAPSSWRTAGKICVQEVKANKVHVAPNSAAVCDGCSAMLAVCTQSAESPAGDSYAPTSYSMSLTHPLLLLRLLPAVPLLQRL